MKQTKLQERVLTMYQEWRNQHNGNLPLFAHVLIRWKDDKAFVEDYICLHPYETTEEKILSYDGKILFYFQDMNDVVNTLARINDLDKITQQDESAYQVGSQEFVICDVYEFL